MKVVNLANTPVGIEIHCGAGVVPRRKVACNVKLTHVKTARGLTSFSPTISFVNGNRSVSLSFFLPHFFPIALPDGAINFRAYCDSTLKRTEILGLAATELAGQTGKLKVTLMPSHRGLKLALHVGDVSSLHYWQTPQAHRFFRFA